MSLTLTCPCSACFEVDESYAGLTIPCPECQQPLAAPRPSRAQLRTTGWAVASVVLALTGAFTVVGTVFGVVCGAVALVRIARDRDHLAGTGFALFGICMGVAFTALTVFAFTRGELFGVGDQLRAGITAGRVDYDGPLEVVREQQGFKIVRPSEKWGIARRELMQEFGSVGDLMLVNSGRDAYVDITSADIGFLTLSQYRDNLVEEYRKLERNPTDPLKRASGVKVRDSRRLQSRAGCEVVEVQIEMRFGGQNIVYLIQAVKPFDSTRTYVVRAWTSRQRFARNEEEMRKALDSFRVLGRR